MDKTTVTILAVIFIFLFLVILFIGFPKKCNKGSTSGGWFGGCIPCKAGTFNNDGGVCTSCPAGSYAGAKGAVSCSPCPVGQWSDTTGATECVKCPAGTHNSDEGGSSHDSCIPCAAGTYSNAAKAECTPCAIGQYQPTPENERCLSCPPGQIGKSKTGMTDTTDCEHCPINTYSRGGGSKCTACDLPYEWTDKTGSEYCNKCNKGSYVVTDTIGRKSCQQCERNTFNSVSNSIDEADCKPCPHGWVSGPGSWFCHPDPEECPETNDESEYKSIVNETCNMYPSSFNSDFLVMDLKSLGLCNTCDFSFINTDSNVVSYTDDELDFWYNLPTHDRTQMVTYIQSAFEGLKTLDKETGLQFFADACEAHGLQVPADLGGPEGVVAGAAHGALTEPFLFFPLYVTCPNTRLSFNDMIAKMKTTVWYQSLTNSDLSGKTEQCDDCVKLFDIYTKMFYNFRSLQIAFCTKNPTECSENWDDFNC